MIKQAITRIVNRLMPKKIILKDVFKDWTITQLFGKTDYAKAHPAYYTKQIHKGIDYIDKNKKWVIYAPHNAIVVKVGHEGNKGKGQYISLWDRQQEIATHYYHLDDVFVKRNQMIESGCKIGIAGNTGFSKGKHLHFALYKTADGYIINIDSDSKGAINPYNKDLVRWK